MSSFTRSRYDPGRRQKRNDIVKVSLQLANALSQNCGIQMHRELASRSFTDAILRLANDRVRFSLHMISQRPEVANTI